MIASIKTIAVDLTPLLPGGENGGAKIFVLELIRQLANLTPHVEFLLLTQAASHDELKRLEQQNISCIMVLNNTIKTTTFFRTAQSVIKKLPYLGSKLGSLGYRFTTWLKRKQAHSLLRNLKADLLFCPFTAPTYYEPGIPTVCTIYDLQYKTFPEFFSPDEVIHRNHTFYEACRRADKLTAISEYSRQSAIKHGDLKPQKIHTIYLQMAQRILPNKKLNTDILKRLGLKPQQYLLYPANFWKHKNHEMLLTAFGIACTSNLSNTIKLVCTGAEGVRHSWLQDATTLMKLSDRVQFPGFLTDEELTVLISNSNAVIFPSLYEGFGLPVIEAMAAGIPVACSNVTSLPEIASNAALLFNPRIPSQIAEALITLTSNEELRQQLISAGKERAKLFSDSKRMAQEYWAVFQNAIDTYQKQDEVSGIFEDGWVGSSMNVQIAPNTNQQFLEMEFFAPEWIPQSKIVVKAIRENKVEGVPLEIYPGNKGLLTFSLPLEGGQFAIRLSPTFIPAKTGLNHSDQRELSLFIENCIVKQENGLSIELISRKKSA